MILGSAIMVGVNTDHDYPAENAIDTAFNAYFLVELCYRFWLNGFSEYLIGPNYRWNILDIGIVLMGIVDTCLLLVDTDVVDPKMFTILRLVRLLRIAKLLRVLRISIFRELLMMIDGMSAGIKTIAWVIVLLSFLIYILSILLVYSLDLEQDYSGPAVSDLSPLIGDVANASFTIFRCFLGDCSTDSGTPLAHILFVRLGAIFGFAYYITMVYMTFGLLSLVIGIITENMMDAAKAHELKVNASDEDKIRVALCMKDLLNKFHDLCDAAGTVGHVTRAIYAEAIEDDTVSALMDEIGLDEHNRMDLFDSMDADGDGTLEMLELVKGFIRMRGDVKKSDIITSRLVVRALQKDFGDFKRRWLQQSHELEEFLKKAQQPPSLIQALPSLSQTAHTPRSHQGETISIK